MFRLAWGSTQLSLHKVLWALFLRCKVVGVWGWALHLVPRLSMIRALYALHLYAFMACTGTILPLPSTSCCTLVADGSVCVFLGRETIFCFCIPVQASWNAGLRDYTSSISCCLSVDDDSLKSWHVRYHVKHKIIIICWTQTEGKEDLRDESSGSREL